MTDSRPPEPGWAAPVGPSLTPQPDASAPAGPVDVPTPVSRADVPTPVIPQPDGQDRAPQPNGPERPGVRSPLSDGEWHHLHPLTPLLRGGLFLLVIIGVFIANARERLLELFVPAFSEVPPGEYPPDPIDFILGNNLLLIAGGGVLAVLIVLLVAFRLSWRFHTFRIGADDVEVRSGVLFRTHRRAPLDRVQGVNLTRPMIARLLGMAKLEVVGAGLDANVKLEYLGTRDADTVRGDILRLASGRRLAAASTRGASPAAAGPGSLAQRAAGVVGDGVQGIVVGEDLSDAEPESVVRIPVGRLAASRLLGGSTVLLLVFVVVTVVAASTSTLWVLFSVVPAFLGFAAYYVRSLARGLRYSIAPTPDGVRVTFGLFTTVSEVVPPGRIHAVEVRQPLLWRPFGWWAVSVNRLSGRGATDTSTDQFAAVLPVGTRADVERVLGVLAPGLPPEEWAALFEDGVLGPRPTDPFTTTPARARLLRLFSWRRNGFLLTHDALFLRRGWLWRSLSVFPLARLQSVGVRQGPFARAMRTATVTAHVIPGSVPTSVGVLDRDDAVRLLDDTSASAVAAAAGDRSHRWAG
ncbi:PH domain-containing protein [Microbacterium sp. LMI1-1-1.1]|uniref:PH domain-containing protein n=1 Tax=Microbacterium sp. LMI1-1-1.1 TaxID=3135223 RepID=UPI0034660282